MSEELETIVLKALNAPLVLANSALQMCRAIVEAKEDELKTAQDRATAVEKERENWKDSAAQFCRNSDFYRGLVSGIGVQFGEAAYISDDGSKQQDVLALKVPELVAEALKKLAAAEEALKRLTTPPNSDVLDQALIIADNIKSNWSIDQNRPWSHAKLHKIICDLAAWGRSLLAKLEEAERMRKALDKFADMFSALMPHGAYSRDEGQAQFHDGWRTCVGTVRHEISKIIAPSDDSKEAGLILAVVEAAKDLEECPNTPDTATYNQAKGIESAPPYQAVLNVSIAWTRWKRLLETLAALEAARVKDAKRGEEE